MKRITVAVTALALAVCSTQGALAATKPKPKPKPVAAAKPIPMTYYLHGTSANGNQDENPATGGTLGMDATKPTGTSAKEYAYFGGGATPNQACAGGEGVFPYFEGKLSGTVTGSATVTFWVRSTPGVDAVVQIFNDAAPGSCNDTFPTPMGQATVAIPVSPTPSQVTVTIPLTGKGLVTGTLGVQFNAATTAGVLVGPQVTGISYDATTAMSSVSFSCLPNAGKTAC